MKKPLKPFCIIAGILLVVGLRTSILLGGVLPPETQKVIDSLELIFASKSIDSLRYKALVDMVTEINAIDRSQSIPYLQRLLVVAADMDNEVKIANVHRLFGSQYLYLGQTDSAMVHLEIAHSLYTSNDNLRRASEVLGNLALALQRSNRYEEAVQAYQKSIVFSDSIGDYVGSIYTQLNLMSLFMDLEDHSKALEYFGTIKTTMPKVDMTVEANRTDLYYALPAIFNNAGQSMQAIGRLDSAATLVNEGIAKVTSIPDEYSKTYWNGYLANTIGDIYLERGYEMEEEGRPDSALWYRKKSLEQFRLANEAFTSITEERGKTFSAVNTGKALSILGRYEQSNRVLNQALTLARKIGFKEEIRDAYEYLAINTKMLGNSDAALNYFEQFVEYKDSVRNEERDKVVNGLQVRFEATQKDLLNKELQLETEALEREQERRNLIYLITLLSILGVGFTLFSRIQYKKQKAIADYQRDMNLAMSRFVPMGFIRALGKEKITDVRLGDQIEKEVTVVFTDIRSFTTISEGMTPHENFAFVKEYAERMGPIIERNHGFISSYLGDGIMAIFQRERHGAEDALQACIQMQEDIVSYNVLVEARGRNPIKVGMGMHTGPLVMGIIGDESRWDATLISDTVNTASRIEQTTKKFQSPILISESCRAAIPEVSRYPLKRMGEVTVQGRVKPVEVFELRPDFD